MFNPNRDIRTLEVLRDLRQKSFKTVQERDINAALKAVGFEDPDKHRINRGIDKYLEDLPTFKGKTIVDHLNEDRRNPKVTEVKVLDLGCGTGTFLAEIASQFPKVSAYGISATDLRAYVDPQLADSLSSVDYTTGDIQQVRKHYEAGQFDYVVSDWTLRYTADPLTVVKQVYQILDLGGIAFLQDPRLKGYPGYGRYLQEYWEKIGIDVEAQGFFGPDHNFRGAVVIDSFDISFQRSKVAKLPMPFKYEVYSENSIGYKEDFRKTDKVFRGTSW